MDTYIEAGNLDDIALGRKLISEGKVGCIVLAGGDGSRLGWSGPKGTFPLSLVKQKNLFQILSERVDAASKHFCQELKVAVMTSPHNELVTQDALPKHFHFFSQNLVPLLDMEENVLDEARPNGNGEVLKCFYESGLFAEWKNAGITLVQVILVDNPLAEPFDPNQVGAHARLDAEVSVKAVKKNSPNENVGVIGKKEGKLCIVEYSESPPKDWNLANTSLFCFSMDFIEKVKDVELPLHVVKKFLQSRPVLKRETFIFDLLRYASKAEVILYPRHETFAPLKNRDDVGPVQRALLERDKSAFLQLTGTKPEDGIFELDASFHYPTEAIKQKWQGCELPKNSYIEP